MFVSLLYEQIHWHWPDTIDTRTTVLGNLVLYTFCPVHLVPIFRLFRKSHRTRDRPLKYCMNGILSRESYEKRHFSPLAITKNILAETSIFPYHQNNFYKSVVFFLHIGTNFTAKKKYIVIGDTWRFVV